MIKLLPVFAILAASIFFFLKAFDAFIELVLFVHSLCKYRYVFDDYEAELFQLENAVKKGKNDMAEVRESMENDLVAYRELISTNKWKYRFCKLFFSEHRLVRANRKEITG